MITQTTTSTKREKLIITNHKIMKEENLYENDYIWLFQDWTLWISDWVGYLDTMEKDEVKELYIALNKFYNIK